MRRHSHILLRRDRILHAPKARHSLPLRIEPQPILTIEVTSSSSRNGLLVAREPEYGQRDGNGNVDTQLASFDLLLEPRGSGAGFREDGSAVAVLVGVDELDGFIGGFDVEAHEHGPEDLFRVAFHVWLYVRDDGGPNLGSALAGTS